MKKPPQQRAEEAFYSGQSESHASLMERFPYPALEPGATTGTEKAVLLAISYGGHLLATYEEMAAIAGIERKTFTIVLNRMIEDRWIERHEVAHPEHGRRRYFLEINRAYEEEEMQKMQFWDSVGHLDKYLATGPTQKEFLAVK